MPLYSTVFSSTGSHLSCGVATAVGFSQLCSGTRPRACAVSTWELFWKRRGRTRSRDATCAVRSSRGSHEPTIRVTEVLTSSMDTESFTGSRKTTWRAPL
ncbi:hypothetical protein DPMN_030692 [Dreissena polymorpha]|uniref:Uncharacterized protein n=1 Tax=Dreissena polymorpha TaxID=45954 RepID=A0A9D4LYL8_DREPO|nr:hypothetical protein DPMN_030692 [Dreissena polymorpha]